ncbi:hypothetical protein [Phenylobacterium sp.]|uniref:hypothetical protein n=1 Tax=Phenylobacterium sp. TaxID=1871053 RepID=UPI0027225199|nr:hypothetical protein [Phenylobacterium sp.]MDO8380681.1 hypothetical protein [Phenylobacterium sp.]
MNASEKQKATREAAHARLYPLFKELEFRRGAKLPVKRMRSRLGWRRMREGQLDQVGLHWSKYSNGRFVIEWMTTDPRVVVPPTTYVAWMDGRIYRGPPRWFSLNDSDGEWFRWSRDLAKEMDTAETRMRELDRYLRDGTPMKFMCLPEAGALTPAGIEAWAKADQADQAD